MLQWIRKNGLEPVHLTLLLLSLFFVMHRFSWVTVGLCGLLYGAAFLRLEKKACVQLCVLVLPMALFFFFQNVQWTRQASNLSEHLSVVRMLPDTIDIDGDRLSFRGKAAGRLYQVFYRLESPQEKAYFQGLTEQIELEVDAELQLPEEQRNFNGFDYRAYLKTQGIYQIARLQKIKGKTVVSQRNIFDWLSVWRRTALVVIKQRFPRPMSHYMTGLLFGDLDSEFDWMGKIYSQLGIIHLFALSGMQVGFFIQAFRYLLLRMGVRREVVDIVQLPFSFLYAGLTGFSASVIRSLLQKLFGNVGLRGLDNIAVTLLVCLLFFPRFFLTIGGVLTFSYAFLLTLFPIEETSYRKRLLMEGFGLSFGILPILMFYFHSFQPLSIVLTFVFSVLFDQLILPALSVIFLLAPVFPMTQVNGLFVGLEKVIVWVAELPFPPLILGKPSPFVLLLLLFGILFLYDSYRKKWCVAGLGILLLGCFLVTKRPLENEITMVDVGQGDSLFLRDYYGRTILIDVGGKVEFSSKEAWRTHTKTSNAERTLIPYLHSRGVGRIDHLVLTHTDTDHVGDVLEVASKVAIGRIYISEGSLSRPTFLQTLKEIGVPIHVVKAGERLPIFDSYLEVLYPIAKGDGGNNDSIVLYGNLLGTNFLFTGDLEDGELDLLRQYPDLKVDVLKAGHHGSKGSSLPVFLDHIDARVALVSAGKGNRYKHPHKETLERFAERGMRVYRTDQQGAVRLRGWNHWQIETVRTLFLPLFYIGVAVDVLVEFYVKMG